MGNSKWCIHMVMLALGKKPLFEKHCCEGSDQDGNSYQNAIGSARRVVGLVKILDLEASTQTDI